MGARQIRYSIPPNGAFLAAVSRSRHLTEAIAFEDWRAVLPDLPAVMSAVLEAFGGHMEDVEVKIVASDPQIESLVQKVRGWPASKVEAIVRPASALNTVYFDRDNGRLLIEKPVTEPLKVLVVDDSQTIRNLLSTIINKSPDMKVVAVAEHPSQARDLILQHKPDVMTLDIHMPDIDGVTLLKKLMPEFHIRTVMISSLSPDDGPMVFEAMAAGAIDYIQKPEYGKLEAVAPIMLDKIRAAARARQPTTLRKAPSNRKSTVRVKKIPKDLAVVAIGSSTGGPEALKEVLESFGHQIPPTVIVQHIPAEFSAALAQRLNQMFSFEVREAKDGDRLRHNLVLIAPGGQQMQVKKAGEDLYVRLSPASKSHAHNPSVDVLFESLAECAGARTIAAVLTGMGQDGAVGAVQLKGAGGLVVAQDEETSVVYGMPRAAFEKGGTHDVAPLHDIASVILSWIQD